MPACREGERTELVFCASAVLFPRSGGGGVFRQIFTIGDGTSSILCMPTGREGKLGEPFYFALPLFKFPGPGGVFFWQILQPAAALLVYACQRVGRASGLNLDFCVCAIPFSRSEGQCFRVISTIGGGAVGGYMPAGREGKRAAPFSFVLRPLNFLGVGGRGGASFGGSLPSAAALWYMHVSVSGGRADRTLCLLCVRLSIFQDRETMFSGDIYNRRWRFWWKHVSGTGREA